MAAIKQCVACNRQIPESWNSCQCGHVSTETLTIAGKRFSDYRAELYTRLVMEESKRQAQKSRVRKHPATRRDTSSQAEKRKSLRNKLGGRRRRRRRRNQSLLLAKEAKETTGNAENLNTPTAERTTKLGDCEELAAQTKKSFTSALAEINKRLQNQGKLWACLASGLPISAHT